MEEWFFFSNEYNPIYQQIKEKKIMIISAAKQAFGKIQQPFLIKAL